MHNIEIPHKIKSLSLFHIPFHIPIPENDHDNSLLKPPSNLELLVNQFNNATPENSNDPEKIFHVNIMALRKCITLKYLTKLNHYPYSI